jgi:benzoyl-CoA reductase/2-hydroxyglutaryl-CoA dehydratase subunit BcrC/BadD/HgdB
MPDLKVVAEMQMAIATRLVDVTKARREGKPIVWCSVVMPKEILFAMDVTAEFSELLGGYASIFGLSGKYCQVAEEDGLSRDVCAVHRGAIGLACADKRDDFFAASFVPPDLVIGNNFACTSESKSFVHVAHKYKVPYYVIDTPINTWGKNIPEHAVKYYADELRGLIAFLERHGHRLDEDRLREEVAFTKKLNTVLAEIEDCRKAVPMPMKAYDTVIASTAPLALPKDARKLSIFERLRDELRERVDKGIGVVPDEKLRLLWIGIPPLCDFKLLNYPERHGAVVVKNMLEFLTGFTLDPDLIDPDQPLESIARAQIASPANPLYGSVIDYLVSAARDYKIDGVVSVVKRTCGLVPGMQRLTKEAIFREVGVPAVVFDLDGIDEREYDAAATKAQLDAFVETLLDRKARGGTP